MKTTYLLTLSAVKGQLNVDNTINDQGEASPGLVNEVKVEESIVTL